MKNNENPYFSVLLAGLLLFAGSATAQMERFEDVNWSEGKGGIFIPGSKVHHLQTHDLGYTFISDEFYSGNAIIDENALPPGTPSWSEFGFRFKASRISGLGSLINYGPPVEQGGMGLWGWGTVNSWIDYDFNTPSVEYPNLGHGFGSRGETDSRYVIIYFRGLIDYNAINKLIMNDQNIPSEEEWLIEMDVNHLDSGDVNTYFDTVIVPIIKPPINIIEPADGSTIKGNVMLVADATIKRSFDFGDPKPPRSKFYYREAGADEWIYLDIIRFSRAGEYIDENGHPSWNFRAELEFDTTVLPDAPYEIKSTVCRIKHPECYAFTTNSAYIDNSPNGSEPLPDITVPVLSNEQPRGTINNRKPLIAITANDPESGIDAESIDLNFNNIKVPENFDTDSNIISYKPNSNLSYGTYDVSVKVFNGQGLFSEMSWNFEVSEIPVPVNPPNAELSVNRDRGEGPLDVNFSYNCEQLDILLTSCKLDFGDGNYIELLGNDTVKASGEIMHTYPQNQDYYTVMLTARDNSGNISKDFVKIYSFFPENEAPVIDNIIATPLFSDPAAPGENVVVYEGEGIKFEALVTDADLDELTYIWDFGDGEIETRAGSIVYHSYFFTEGKTDNTYTVKLTVSDGELEESYNIEIIAEKALVKIKVLNPDWKAGSLDKGDNVKVKVEITDIDDKLLNVNDIKGITAYFIRETNKFPMEPDQDGFYWGNINSSKNTPNVSYFFVIASAVIGLEEIKTGTVSKVYFIPLEFETRINTIPSVPYIGSTLEHISIVLDYPDGEPVRNASVVGRIQGSDLGNIVFSETVHGTYGADLDYEVREIKGITLMLKANDNYGNGSGEFQENWIFVYPFSPELNLLVAILGAIFIGILGSYLYHQWRKDKERIRINLLQEKQNFEDALKNLNYQYHKRSISEDEYKEKVLETEQQLAIVEEMLGVEKTTDLIMSEEQMRIRKGTMLGLLKKEIKDVNKLTGILKRKTVNYTRKEMREAIISQGYSRKVADKVVKILYKKMD